MIKYKLLIYFTAIFFSSCNNTKEPEKSEYEIRWGKQKQLDTLNQNAAIALSKQHDAITDKDSTVKFTYQIQEIVKKYGKPISFTGYISDIIQHDSIYVLKLYGTFAKQESFGEILISAEQFQELNKQLDFKSRNKGCFIFTPTGIKSSSMLTIDSEVSTDEDAESVDEANANASSELTYEFHDVLLFFKGHMITFYLYKRLEKDED